MTPVDCLVTPSISSQTKRQRISVATRNLLISSFMRVHAQAMNEYRGGEMSTEVVVDGNDRPWTEVKVFCERSSMVELLTFVCTNLVRGLY